MFYRSQSTHRKEVGALRRRCTAALLSAVLAALPLLCLAQSGAAPVAVSAEESVDELRDEKEQLEAQQKELEAQRNKTAEDLKAKEAEKALIGQQIAVKAQEIDVNMQLIEKVQEKITDKEYEIAAKKQEVDRKEAEIADNFETLRQRLRAISKSGSLTNSLQLLLNSDGYSDYLVQNKAMERVSAQDQALMDGLEKELQVIQTAKAELEAQKEELNEEYIPLAELQNELNLKKQELDALYSEANAITEQLNQDIDNYNQSIEEKQAAAAALQDKIDDIIRSSVTTGQTFLSGSMYWPAPACNYISSTFKYRWGRWHQGIDITGSNCYGSEVVAAASGVVVTAEYDSGGYGYYVIIDHGTDSAGQRIMTVYAHNSSLIVSVGETVVATQVIAYAGSTGNSTGAHLHFEVRVDGTAVDPIANGYVSTDGIIVDESL